MKVLAIDTSNKTMAVALAEEGNVVAVKKINIKRNHSIQLMPAVESLVKEVGWQPKDLDRIAVANGPGSYTGVRIAVTTAKTLAWALQCELVTYSSLEAMVLGHSFSSDKLLCPLFDARRDNLYTGLYQITDTGKVVSVKEDRHVSLTEWLIQLVELNQPIEFIGEDVGHFYNQIKEQIGDRVRYNSENDHLPKVESMAINAVTQTPVSIHEVTPDYLKMTEAEENWMKENPNHKRGHFVEKIQRVD